MSKIIEDGLPKGHGLVPTVHVYTKEDIIKYIMTTINNTNPAILLEMLNNMDQKVPLEN